MVSPDQELPVALEHSHPQEEPLQGCSLPVLPCSRPGLCAVPLCPLHVDRAHPWWTSVPDSCPLAPVFRAPL